MYVICDDQGDKGIKWWWCWNNGDCKLNAHEEEMFRGALIFLLFLRRCGYEVVAG